MSLVVSAFHGTWHRFSRFSQSGNGVGHHFGCLRQANRRIAMAIKEDNVHGLRELRADGLKPRVIEARLTFENPLISLDDPSCWDSRRTLGMIRPVIGESAYRSAKYEKKGVLRQLLQEAGYDGVIYRNIYEGRTRRMAGKSDWAYLAFDVGQIDIIDHDVQGSRPDIEVPEIVRDAEMAIGNWRRRDFSFTHQRSRKAFAAAAHALLAPYDAKIYRRYEWEAPNFMAAINLGGQPQRIEVAVEEGYLNLGHNPFLLHFPNDAGEIRWEGTETIDDFVSRIGELLAEFACAIEANANPAATFAA